MGFNHWKIIMNITKITKDVYSWDAAVDVSRDAAIKFAYDILSFCDVNPLQPIKGDETYTIKSINLLDLNVKHGNIKYKFIDQLETYGETLEHCTDGWRLPTLVDVLNVRNELEQIFGHVLYSLKIRINLQDVNPGSSSYVCFDRFFPKYEIHTIAKTEKQPFLLVKDLS